MKVKEAYLKGKKILDENLIEDCDIKVRILMCFILNIRKELLIVKLDEELERSRELCFFDNVEKLKEGMPIQYITHSQEFMKLNFYVDENVLIPQPDTEVLVEETIKIAKKGNKILDLCTGSGAIAISLCKYLLNINMYASDISSVALDIAGKNAKNNNVQVNFIESDLFKNINEKEFDVIVSNPPYIENSVISTLSAEVKHEPILALAGGNDGLEFYRRIAENAQKYLKQDGYLCLEIGYNQKENVMKILKNQKYREVTCIKDLSENDRVIIAKK